MNSLDHDKARQFARDVVERLRGAGHEALWAGGCVRDELLGEPPKDYDVATSATPEEVRELFGRRRTIPVGASFGVITVLGPRQAGQIEVATFRSDLGYSDGRRPDEVVFTTAENDAQRRDFTINGLFYDPIEDDVIDYVGGQADLKLGVIRAIGDPEARFNEDKLRILRAVRFAARFGFEIESSTARAIHAHAGAITQVSGERVGAEMRAMLVHPHRARGLQLLRETGLETYVLPELAELEPSGFEEMLTVVDRLNAPTFATVLAAIVRGLVDVRIASGIARRWKLANRDAARADWLLEQLPSVAAAANVPWPRLQRVLMHEGAAELVALAEAIAGPDDSAVRLCREKLALPAEELNPPPLVTGDDLIAHGLAPCPEFGAWLSAIRDAQLEGKIATREEALELAERLAGV